jgi:hypothetical protein
MKRILIFTLIALGSCKSSKSINSNTEVIRDTIRLTNNVEIFRSVHDTLTIENPCDSLSLKDFYYKSNLPLGSVIIRSIKGNIQATINIDSVRQIYSSMYKASNNSKTQFIKQEVIKYRVPTWAIYIILIETLIIGLYLYFRLIWK